MDTAVSYTHIDVYKRQVIVDHEKVRYHSLFFGIGRSYPLRALTRVCRD